MCRERATLAKKEMDYWLAEAEEWKRLKEAPDQFTEGFQIQLDLVRRIQQPLKLCLQETRLPNRLIGRADC